MRILVGNGCSSVVGGRETYLAQVIPALRAAGHQLAFLHDVGESTQNPLDCGHFLERSWTISPSNQNSVERSVLAWHPDVIFQNGLENRDLETSLSSQIPSVFFAHGHEGVCLGGKMFKRPNVEPCYLPFGAHCYSNYYLRGCGAGLPHHLLKIALNSNTRRRLFSSYSHILVASEYMGQLFEQNGIDSSRIKIVNLPNTCDRDLDPPIPRPYRGDLLVVARLVLQKGAHLALRAYELLLKSGDARSLTIVGDGPERHKLEELSQKHNLSIAFCGWLGRKDTLEAMRAADLLVVPSIWPEPFGLVGVEAGGVGTPVVAFSCGGIKDWLRPERNGASAGNVYSPESLAVAIRSIKKISTETYGQLRLGAWQVAGEFSMNQHLLKLMAALESAPKERAKRDT